jgi:RNA polymerase sigma-70 factor (ECF subfamily)
MARIRHGDSRAFAELYHQYFSPLGAFALRYVRDRDVAEDIVHDVFFKLWAMHATVDVRTTIRAYLFGAVANRARDAAAQIRRDTAARATITNEAQARSHTAHHASALMDDPVESVESDDLRQVVMTALAALPERQQLAFTFRLVHEMTYEEIATVLGVTKGAVSQLIHKAQTQLKRALRDYLP